MSDIHCQFFTLNLMDLEGRLLSPTELADLQAHLDSCPDCQMDRRLYKELRAQAASGGPKPAPIDRKNILQAWQRQTRLKQATLPLRAALWVGVGLLMLVLIDWFFTFLRPAPDLLPSGEPTPLAPTLAVTAIPTEIKESTSSAKKILPDQPHSFDNFGAALAVQGDLLAVGAPGTDWEGARNAGAAYLFEKNGEAWQQIARLSPDTPQPDGRFGSSMAIDGGILVVGAPYEFNSESGNASGAVYIFTEDTRGWVLTARLSAPDGEPFDLFGSSIAIRGSDLAVGAQAANGPQGQRDAGAVYVYAHENGGWTLQTRLGTEAAAFDHFGHLVAFAGDELFVGAPDVDFDQAPNAGQVYIYTSSGGNWKERARLTAEEVRPQARFGTALAVQSDLLAVVAPQEYQKPGPVPPNAFSYESTFGVVHVFQRSGGQWNWQARLYPIPVDEQHAMRISSVVLETVRDQVRLGLSGYGMGGVFPFELQNGTWQAQPEVVLPQFSLVEGQVLGAAGNQMLLGNRFHEDIGQLDGSGNLVPGAVWILDW